MGSDAMPRHFGILVPSTNTTGEVEYCRLAPELQVHTGRLGKAATRRSRRARMPTWPIRRKLLGDARVEVIALAQTSARPVRRRLRRGDGEADDRGIGVPSLTSAQAIGRALKALKASRVAMATPYSEEVIGRARRYYETKVRHRHGRLGKPGASDAYAIGKMDAGMAEAAFRRSIGRTSTRWWCRRQFSDHGLDRRLGAPVRQAGDHHQSAALWAGAADHEGQHASPRQGSALEQLPAG